MAVMINIQNISKQYKDSDSQSLESVVLQIPQQSVFGLLGPNGAGKTTLISILCGILKPTSGAFEIDGSSSVQNPSEIKNKIGVGARQSALQCNLTAFENLMQFRSLYNVPKKELEPKTTDYLTHLRLNNFRHKQVQTFSGGMERRVNLIAGILH